MLATLQSEATLACIDLSCSDPTGLPPPSGEMWAWLESDAPFVGIASSSNRLIQSQKSVPLIASTLRPLSVCGSSPATLRPPSHRIPCRVETGVDPTGGAVDAERGFEAAHGRRRDGDGADG